MSVSVSIRGQEFILHPTKTIYWPNQKMLLVADVHLGKIAHFRKFGSALPPQAIEQNFLRLQESIDAFNPSTICFLGDLFHSHQNEEWGLFSEWIRNIRCTVVLVSGNHDIIPEIYYEKIDVEVMSEWVVDDFLLSHHPEERPSFFNFCGHIHPAVFLYGHGRQKLKLPCFFHHPNQMILPAFGVFTGTHVLQAEENDLVYGVSDEEVVKVEYEQLSRR